MACGVSGKASRVIVGLNWTLVAGPDGAGVSHTPTRGTNGCRALPRPGDYTGRDLSELAALRQSANIFEATIAIAAMNAFHNRFDRLGGTDNGLDLVEDRGTKTVIVGRFPGLDRRLPGAAVIEREPGPNDYPESAAETLLPQCEQLVITASTLLDGALPRLLDLAPQAFTVLLGPGTPLAAALFDQGVDALAHIHFPTVILPGHLLGTAHLLDHRLTPGQLVELRLPDARPVPVSGLRGVADQTLGHIAHPGRSWVSARVLSRSTMRRSLAVRPENFVRKSVTGSGVMM